MGIMHGVVDGIIALIAVVSSFSGFVVQEGMVESLDGPHVGFGIGLGRDPQRGRFEVECCRIQPGKHGLLVTGNVSHIMRECVDQAHFLVRGQEKLIQEKMGLGDRLNVLHTGGCDVHIHASYGWEQHDDVIYGPAVAVALVGLLIGQRQTEDTAVIGQLLPNGWISGFRWHGFPILDLCKSQGVRRLILSDDVAIPEADKLVAGALEPDGRPRLELIAVFSLTEALPFLFPKEGRV